MMLRIHNKRLTLVLLALLMTLCCAAASADTVRLTVQGCDKKTSGNERWIDRPVLVSFHETYPDITLSVSTSVDYRTTRKLLQALDKKEYKADVFTMDSAQVDIQAVLSGGGCLDLTDNPEIASLLAQMHPTVAAAAQVDGRIYGVPVDLSTGRQLFYEVRGWQAAGLTAEDVPSSYTGLLDFLEAWVLRQQTNPVSVCVTGDFDSANRKPTDYTTWLLDILLRGYAMQCAASGQPATYDDPTLLALLERTREVGAQLYELRELERQVEYGGLFTVLTGQPQLLLRMVPDRLTDEDPLVISATVTIACVNANRPKNAEAAQRFLAYYMTWVHDHTPDAYGLLEDFHDEDGVYNHDDYWAEHTKGLLFADAKGPIHSLNPHAVASISATIQRYQDMLDGNVENLSSSSRKAIPKTEEQREKLRADIEILKSQEHYERRYRDALDFTEDELARYQEMTTYFVFLQNSPFETISNDTRKLLTRYANGDLTTEQLAQKLMAQ